MEIDRQRLTADERYRNEVLTEIIRDYGDQIVRYCVERVGEDFGEEVAQDVFVTAWHNLPSFRQESSILSWLFGIARYKCRQIFSKHSNRQAIVDRFTKQIRQHVHPGLAEKSEVAQKEALHEQLIHGLMQLQDIDKLLVMLRYFRGMSISEISELTLKSEASVRQRIHRALQRLKKIVHSAESN